MFLLSYCLVEDQKEVPSPINPELRHKEVQMNFFNQLTSVFNPDITVLSSPSAHMQVSKLETRRDHACISIWILCANICIYTPWNISSILSQAEGEIDDQTTTDQAAQTKMKNAFISQNVSSLQELGVFV